MAFPYKYSLLDITEKFGRAFKFAFNGKIIDSEDICVELSESKKQYTLHVHAITKDLAENCWEEFKHLNEFSESRKKQTLLHKAVLRGYNCVGKLLIEFTELEYLELGDIDGNTALHFAAKKDNSLLSKALMRRASPRLYLAKNHEESTALEYASRLSSFATAEPMINDIPKELPLEAILIVNLFRESVLIATRNNKYQTVQLLLEKNEDLIDTRDTKCHNFTLLHLAIGFETYSDDQPELTEVLMRKKPILAEVRDDTGSTALDKVIRRRHYASMEIMVKLCRKEVLLYMKYKDNVQRLPLQNAIHLCTSWGHVKSMKILLDNADADYIKSKDGEGRTAWDYVQGKEYGNGRRRDALRPYLYWSEIIDFNKKMLFILDTLMTKIEDDSEGNTIIEFHSPDEVVKDVSKWLSANDMALKENIIGFKTSPEPAVLKKPQMKKQLGRTLISNVKAGSTRSTLPNPTTTTRRSTNRRSRRGRSRAL
eukprot:TRINITY_DN284652_c0_g2_i1.p1 TRINITY_DN284652_c0_g2~~TRINITY_DN284652_c0_g2_i1.p1  ORF type:complete len:483 (+),score=98.44 TRINITY_DN284652_c0_g2_i1:195-1643(+)